MQKALFALLFIGAAFAAQDEIVTLIQKIDATPIGRTLFDTIWLQLEAQEPLDRLLGTLSDLEDKYFAEQKEDDGEHRDYQDNCTADLAVYDQDLAESTTLRITLEAKLEGSLYPQREIIQGIVNQKKKELAGYQKELNSLDQERQEEHDEFEAKVREHEEATAVITEVRRLFTENLQAPHGESVFLQRGKINPKAFITQEATSLIQKQLLTAAKRVSKFVHRKGYAKVFKVLATIASKAHQVADQSSVNRIVELCDELLQKIQDSLDLERFAEDKRIESYKKARNLLTITINVTQSAFANAQTELASVQDQIHLTETSLENVNQRIANKSEERKDRFTQCEQAAADYQEQRKSRDADRQVVSDCLGLVNKELRTLKEQLAIRMQAGEKLN